MIRNVLVQQWETWRHLQNLIRFRNSGAVLDAGEDWLDKEIMDLQRDYHLAYQSA